MPGSLHTLLVLPDLRAETEVHLGPPGVQAVLGSFFAGLADAWRGWTGVEVWEAYEGGLRLSCRHDGLGTVFVAVELSERSGPDGWHVQGEVQVDAGEQLAQLARSLSSLDAG